MHDPRQKCKKTPGKNAKRPQAKICKKKPWGPLFEVGLTFPRMPVGVSGIVACEFISHLRQPVGGLVIELVLHNIKAFIAHRRYL